MIELEVRTNARRQMVDVTRKIQEAVMEAGIDHGQCLLWVPHTTAAVVVNEHADPDVARDLVAAYEAMIPDIRFAHGEGNSDAHLLATVLGSSLTMIVNGGRLALGTWQGVFFVELDGARRRRIWVDVR